MSKKARYIFTPKNIFFGLFYSIITTVLVIVIFNEITRVRHRSGEVLSGSMGEIEVALNIYKRGKVVGHHWLKVPKAYISFMNKYDESIVKNGDNLDSLKLHFFYNTQEPTGLKFKQKIEEARRQKYPRTPETREFLAGLNEMSNIQITVSGGKKRDVKVAPYINPDIEMFKKNDLLIDTGFGLWQLKKDPHDTYKMYGDLKLKWRYIKGEDYYFSIKTDKNSVTNRIHCSVKCNFSFLSENNIGVGVFLNKTHLSQWQKIISQTNTLLNSFIINKNERK